LANFIKGFRCTLCNKIYSEYEVSYTCPNCGEKGILEIEYDYQSMRKFVDKCYFKTNPDFSMWRYHLMMAIEQKHIPKMLKIGGTPLYKANHLHRTVGIKSLYIKDEGQNPSGSLKDRASGVAVLKAIEKGYKTIACSSTGNAASSLACHSARTGLKTVIFVPKRAPIGKINQLSIYGSNVVIVDGDYKDTYELSKKAIDHYGYYNRNAAINPFLVEGKKTVALEIAEQLDFSPTDWVAVSVGDGCTIAGVYKGFYDFFMLGLIDKIPKLLGVQSSGCQPFVTAFETNQTLTEAEENSIADSISVGIPRNPIKAQNAVLKSRGSWVSVSDDEILKYMRKLGMKEGIFGEPAGVAALAGIRKAVTLGIISPVESVTMIMTGNGLKDPKSVEKAIQPPILIKNDFNALENYLKEKGEN
jgi:threonine synthase